VFVEDFGAAARFGRVRFAFAEPDRAVVDEVAEREDDKRGEHGDDNRARAAADQARDPRPASAPLPRLRAPPGPERPPAEQGEGGGQQGQRGGKHHRDPDREDRPEPTGRLEVGEQQYQHRRDHRRGRGGDRPHALDQRQRQCGTGLQSPVELLAVAVDQQQRVVGAGAEDQHQQQERALDVDRDQAGLDQQVGGADRDQVGDADREQRQQRQGRGAVDDQEQQEDQAERRDQQRLAGVFGDPLEIGGDAARAGDVGAQAGMAMRRQIGADLADSLDHRTAIAGVDRQRHQCRFAVAGDRTDAAGDPRHVPEWLLGLAGEGSEDRRRPGEAKPVEPFAEPADRIEVGAAEPAVALEDDQDWHVVATLEVTLEHVDDAGRLGVGRQVAGLPRRGHLADMGPPDEAGDPEQDPDPERQPAPARPGHGSGQSFGEGPRAHGGTLASRSGLGIGHRSAWKR
jgi:hypothetical protein